MEAGDAVVGEEDASDAVKGIEALMIYMRDGGARRGRPMPWRGEEDAVMPSREGRWHGHDRTGSASSMEERWRGEEGTG